MPWGKKQKKKNKKQRDVLWLNWRPHAKIQALLREKKIGLNFDRTRFWTQSLSFLCIIFIWLPWDTSSKPWHTVSTLINMCELMQLN